MKRLPNWEMLYHHTVKEVMNEGTSQEWKTQVTEYVFKAPFVYYDWELRKDMPVLLLVKKLTIITKDEVLTSYAGAYLEEAYSPKAVVAAGYLEPGRSSGRYNIFQSTLTEDRVLEGWLPNFWSNQMTAGVIRKK